MSKLIIIDTYDKMHVWYTDLHKIIWMFQDDPTKKFQVIGTDRYTLDHEHALKQGDNHASN